MQPVMKGVKKIYDKGELFFVYKGMKITRFSIWDYIAHCVSWWYRVNPNYEDFPTLTEAKNYIDKIREE